MNDKAESVGREADGTGTVADGFRRRKPASDSSAAPGQRPPVPRTVSTPFVHEERDVRVLFGTDAFEALSAETGPQDRVLLIASPRYGAQARAALGENVVATVENPTMHVPQEQVDHVLAAAQAAEVTTAVSIGGGSSVGLAKALALSIPLRIISVPTTYAGSEMTRVWGITQDGVKVTGRDAQVAPGTVIYDPRLLSTLPREMAAASAFNALAHAVEALWAPDRTPLSDLMAAEAVRSLLAGVRSATTPEDLLYGAWLAGICLDRTTMSLHHKLCHVLGGTIGLPHAQTHTAVLPHVLAYNLSAAPGARDVVEKSLGHEPALALHRIEADAGVGHGLADLGMAHGDIVRVVHMVLDAPYANPRPPDRPGLTTLLERAWGGLPPLGPD